MKLYSDRAGFLYHVSSGYDCFIPKSLFDVKINTDNQMLYLLSLAERKLGELNAIALNVPDADVFLSMYVQKEAVVSSQIEGTQVSLSDVLQKNSGSNEKRKDTKDVVNYTKALDLGLSLLDTLPICRRLLCQVHKVLLEGGRGENKEPGSVRHSQNWIGGEGCILSQASFVPPCPKKMEEAFSDLEKYMNSDYVQFAPLMQIALIHYQFETIHPFLDGNGRIGRMLFPLFLKKEGILERPLIYLSLYLKQNQTEYYGLLSDVRTKGRYEEWVSFFLKGIGDSAISSISLANSIISLKKECVKKMVSLKIRSREKHNKVLAYMFSHPYFSNADICLSLDVSKPTGLKLISDFETLKIIKKAEADKTRFVTYVFDDYVTMLNKGTEI